MIFDKLDMLSAVAAIYQYKLHENSVHRMVGYVVYLPRDILLGKPSTYHKIAITLEDEVKYQ